MIQFTMWPPLRSTGLKGDGISTRRPVRCRKTETTLMVTHCRHVLRCRPVKIFICVDEPLSVIYLRRHLLRVIYSHSLRCH